MSGPIATVSRVVYQASMPLKDANARRAYQRDYIKRTAERHRERSKEAMRRWRTNNPMARLARDRAYRVRHPDQQNEYQRTWIRSHPEVRKAKNQLRRAREAGAGGKFSTKEWRELALRYDSKCAYCGQPGPLHADHRIPLSRGGPNSIDNILPACRTCNLRKHNRTEPEFRAGLAAERAKRSPYT